MILQSAPWSQEGGRIRQTRSLSGWPFQALFLFLFLFQEGFPMNCEARFWFPPQFWEEHAASKKPWRVIICFLAPKYYPSLALWCTGFSKSWRNKWPCSAPWDREWKETGSEVSKKQERRKSPEDNQLLHPSPNITNHPVSWEISLLQSLWVIIPNSRTCLKGKEKKPNKPTAPFCKANLHNYNF